MRAVHPEVPGYEILGLIGAGGVGQVYRARRARDGAEVAVKLFDAQGTDAAEARARFVREGKFLSALSHPNLISILETGLAGDRPYLAMELVTGGDLRSRLNRQGKLPWAEAARIGLDVASAIVHLHASGLLHRDVKPENVLLTGTGRVKLADLGLVRRIVPQDTFLSKQGKVTGTLWYLAPELLLGRKPGPAVDVYGLGLLLYEMIAGVHPLVSEDLTAFMRKLRQRPLPPLEAPGPLCALVERCAHPEAASRPSAQEAQRELQTQVTGKPPAPADSWWRRLWR